MRALITGIAGQDGSLLAKNLLSRGWTVFGTDASGSRERLWRLERLAIREEVTVFKAENKDVRLFEDLMTAVSPSHVFFMGARSRTLNSEHNLSELFEANYLQVKDLANIASRFDNPWVFLPSSSEVFVQDGQPKSEESLVIPTNAYGQSKASLLEYGRGMADQGFQHCVGILFPHESFLRNEYFLVQKLVNAFSLRFLDKGSPLVHIGNFDSTRDWSSADAVVNAVALLAVSRQTGTFVIGSGKAISISDLVTRIANQFDWQGEFESINGSPTYRIHGHDTPLLIADDNRFEQTRSQGAVANLSKLVKVDATYPIQTFEESLELMRRESIIGNSHSHDSTKAGGQSVK